MEKDSGHTLSTVQLIIALLLAIIVGVGLTVFVILPTEKRIDSDGTDVVVTVEPEVGQNVLAVHSEPIETGQSNHALYVEIDPDTTTPIVDEFGQSHPVVSGVNLRSHTDAFKSETIEISIPADGHVEYKAIMDKGEVLLYSWESSGQLYYDFHAHQEKGNADFWTRYAEGEGNSDNGSIVALYDGQHGWYWLNIEGKTVTVKLHVAGYYNELKEIDLAAEAQAE